jgi:type IV secretion system protein VirB4
MIRVPPWIGRFLEPDIERFVPYAGHIRPKVVALYGGAMLAMFKLEASPAFELEANSARNGREEMLNVLLRGVADPDISICFHLVHRPGATPPPQPKSKHPFVAKILASYERAALQDLYSNDRYISIISHPPGSTKKWAEYLWPFGRDDSKEIALDEERERAIEDICRLVEGTLGPWQPRRLGLAEAPVADTPEDLLDDWGDERPMLPITEIGGALYAIRTAHERLIPHTAGALSSSVYADRVTFHKNYFDAGIPGTPRVGSMVSFQNYPARPRVGMYDTLLRANYPFVANHEARYQSMAKTITQLALTRRQMKAAGDSASDLAEGLKEAMNRPSSQKSAPVLHNFTMSVYGDNRRRLNVHVADAIKKLQEYGGAVPKRERNVWYDGAMQSCYWAQLPGSEHFRPRPGRIDTLDLADMVMPDNYPAGERSGYWGPAILRFKTNGGTAYDHVTHDEDVGHSLYIGRIGAGKSVLADLHIHAHEPVMGNDGIRLVIDKDRSHEPGILSAGGRYAKLVRNRPSGLAPLKNAKNTPEKAASLHRLFSFCIRAGGNKQDLTKTEGERLARAIRRQLEMPPGKRSIAGIREYLGYSDHQNGAGARLEPYCRGASKGWILDNDENAIEITGGGLYGLDFTDLLPQITSSGQVINDDGACSLAAMVVTDELRGLMDGRRIACWFEECRFYLGPLGYWIDDITLTGRKFETKLCLMFQQPEHVTRDALGPSIVAQMRTKFIFPGADYKAAELQELGLTPAAIRMVKGEMTLGKGRRFLEWRGQGRSAVCEFDLSGMDELHMLAYHARAEKAGKYDELHEEETRRAA